MNEQEIKELLLKQKIASKQLDYNNFKTTLFGFSLLFIILDILATFYNSTIDQIDFKLIITFLIIAGTYFFIYQQAKKSKNQFQIALIAIVFYIVHTGFEFLLGLYPKEFLSFLSYSQLEKNYSGGARTLNIITLLIDLIPEIYILIRIAVLTVFIKALITTIFIKKNVDRIMNNNG